MACDIQGQCNTLQGVTRFVGLPAGDRAGGVDEQGGIGHGVQPFGVLSSCDRGDQPEGDHPNEQ